MKQRRLTWAVAVGGALIAGGWWMLERSAPEAVAAPAMAEVELRNRDIALYERRIRKDPQSAEDLARLGALFLQRAREVGDYADFRRAEDAARRSLALRTAHNRKTQHLLAASLLAQHRFVDALEEATRLVAAEPDEPAYRALLAEIQLELGEYDAAQANFRALAAERRSLAVAARLARWAEIRGKTAEARHILEAAVEDATRRTDLPREQIAWFHLRLGDLELRSGRLRAAERALRAGLEIEPNDHRLLSVMARVAAVRGRWDETIQYSTHAGARADLATRALLGDAYAATGDTARAEREYAAIEDAAAANPEPYNRQWTQFRLDHARRLPETRALLEAEIGARRDVLGYDMLAWARYLTCDHVGAASAMRTAMRMGTQDAVLFFHAGMIQRALGDVEGARRLLARALELNPYFHHRQASAARAVLDSLESSRED
jgi:tetratricopeptide (TPR) repeat protein